MRLRDRLGIPERYQRGAVRGMQVVLVGLLFVGVYRRPPDTGIIVNTGMALLVTFLPSLLERDYDIAIDPAIALWITTAVFLHAVGTVGLPGSELGFYRTVWWWDHLTHGLSASVVAAVGYATARAFDEHSEAIVLPSRFVFVFILVFVLAFGVLWEVIEFGLGGLAGLLGGDAVLTQYGLEDTMLDLVFDTLGAVIVAVWGTAHLTDVVGVMTAWLEARGRSE